MAWLQQITLFRKNKWTKLCFYSICYIIGIDYKYENGNNCYIFNTVVHIYLQYIRVWFLLSVCVVQIVPAFCLRWSILTVAVFQPCWWVLDGTITDLWIHEPLNCIYAWPDCTVCAVRRLYSATARDHSEDLLYVKDMIISTLFSSLRLSFLFFDNTVCLLWHAENDTVNMTYSSRRYVC